jgi:hypothetical protein
MTPSWTTVWSDARSGIPAAWYCPQSQIENGESRSSWKASVRSQNRCSAPLREGSRRRIENARAVAARNAPAKRARCDGRSPER